ncbi:hypothetical protein EMIHUDRAFT_370983, partial [Emiliania huxleyi CCMP1516]|uniref:Uncharacterized protein n=2 Tax=Emiliania huxleyi TaxID=2903 RepID=A0A0D3IRP3_EMIH1
ATPSTTTSPGCAPLIFCMVMASTLAVHAHAKNVPCASSRPAHTLRTWTSGLVCAAVEGSGSERPVAGRVAVRDDVRYVVGPGRAREQGSAPAGKLAGTPVATDHRRSMTSDSPLPDLCYFRLSDVGVSSRCRWASGRSEILLLC